MSTPDANFIALFEQVSDPAIIIDGDGERVLAANKAFTDLVARPGASLAGEEAKAFLNFAARTSGTGAESADLVIDKGQTVRVRVERVACRWNDRAAVLCLVKRADHTADEAERELIGLDEMSGLFDYLREATEQLEVVNRVVAAVNSGRTIDEVFSLASEQMRALVPFDRATITLSDADGEHLRVFALSGTHTGKLEVGAVGLMRGSVTELALRQREMIVIPDLRAEKRFNVYNDLQLEGFRSAVCCPLFSTHAAVGSLNLTCRTPHAYDRKHLLALERLAPPLAIAIEKVLLLEQAERRSREMEAAARREQLAGRIGRQLASSLDPSSVLQETVEAIGRALEVERCHIALFEMENDGALVDYEYLARPSVASLRAHGGAIRRASNHARRVLETHTTVSLGDIKDAERDELMSLYERLGVRAVLAAPVRVGGSRDGLLEVHDCSRVRRWTEEEQKLLATVAAQVSIALANAQLYEARRRRTEELAGLYEISRAFSMRTDTAEISGRLTRAIAELVGGEMCLIATYDRRHNRVRAEAPGHNTPREVIRAFQFALDPEGARVPVYRTGEPFASNDPAHDPRFDPTLIARFGIRSVLSVPMRIKRELIGFIYVANRPGGFRERDVQLLEIFAGQVAETIVNARLFATIQAQAEREAVVNRLLLSLQQTGDPKEKVDAVIERIGEVLDLDRCVAVLYADDEHADSFGEWCAAGVDPVINKADVWERSPLRYWLAANRRPLFTDDVATHPLAAGFEDLIEQASIQSMIIVPIMHQGRVIGSLSGHQTRRRRRWAEDDIDLLMAVATHVGSTLENARLIAELREASRLKDDFLATLSHELRTPLTSITGWVELLSENSELLETDADLADGIQAISNSATSLTQLINDLLDLSRIQRSMLRLERASFDINQLVVNAMQAVRQMAAARRLEMHQELDERLPEANVDAQRMQQVLWNLLANAIKFTPEGGRVIVRSRLSKEVAVPAADGRDTGGRWVVIEVEDTGEGIAPDFLPFIWERFRQADSSATRRHGGLGIGLALVKELVEAHGGQVEALSEGRGATFIVRLPVAGAENPNEGENSLRLR